MPYNELEEQINAYLDNPESVGSVQRVTECGLESLPVLCKFLRHDLPIDQTERLEQLLKTVLRRAVSVPMTGRDARRIAQFQKQLGFLLKYKSYAVKAATPVGYSIFLQNEREGFSFQRHVVHKLEVFHILSVKPGGYIFLCHFEDWKKVYETNSFERWLQGEPNRSYEQFKFVPDPGDVFVISELGVVHTVIGCVLEEYATVSTDMVDRLHDQNAGRKIPGNFTRVNVEPELRTVNVPARSRLVSGLGKKSFQTLEPISVQGGQRTVLCDSFVTAARCTIEPGKETAIMQDDQRMVLLRMNQGSGAVVIADSSEFTGAPPSLPFERGDLFLIPPGIRYAVRNESNEVSGYSEHRIAPDVAFI